MKDDMISRQAAIELFKDDIAAVNELNNLPPLPDRMKYVQESVNIIMNTCKSDSIKDKAFRNAARMIQNAIDGEAPDFETIEELPSAQSGWIPVTERLPEDAYPVIVTWKNDDPKSYYQYILGKHYTGVAHFKNGIWYWYSSTTEDVLMEYGRCDSEEFDEAIQVLAWQPLPKPWEGGLNDTGEGTV